MDNDQDIEIEQELAYIHKNFPGYLERFLTLMKEGKIDGSIYGGVSIGDPVDRGCFYGWLFRDDNTIDRTWAIREQLLGSRYDDTPIEQLIVDVEAGDTPEYSPALRTLKEAIVEFLTNIPAV